MRIDKARIVVGVVAALMFARVVPATPVIPYLQDWNSGLTEGWVYSGGANASMANSGTELAITFTDFDDIVVRSGNGDPAYSGDYASLGIGLGVEFDFVAGAQTPLSTMVYLQSTYNGGASRIYAYDVTSRVLANTTNPIKINIGSGGGWVNIQGSGTFSQDLLSVDWIGIYVASGFGAATYNLDNWQFAEVPVPEPETVWMILAVMLSLGITFRGRLIDFLGQLKVKLQKA